MTQQAQSDNKIKISILNVRTVKGDKRLLFDLAIFEYPSDPKLILFKRVFNCSMNPVSPNFLGNKLEEPLRTHVVTFINSLKIPL